MDRRSSSILIEYSSTHLDLAFKTISRLPLPVSKCCTETLKRLFALMHFTMPFGKNGYISTQYSINFLASTFKQFLQDALPERWNWQLKQPDILFYPLRPEFAESTYLLYQATKNPFYLRVGEAIVESLNKFALAPCGYATLHSVLDKSQEDRMESFFLSETCKYLLLVNIFGSFFSFILFSSFFLLC